jgi:hypothetical protein
MLKEFQNVIVYANPLKRDEIEGEGILIKKLGEDNEQNCEIWAIEIKGKLQTRWIHREYH